MSVRLPLQNVLSVTNGIIATGPASTAGGIAYNFTIPQDTDNIVVKLRASILAGGVSATLQTTDDGGTTWYDVARSSIVSNANATIAEWLSAPVIGAGMRVTHGIASVGTGTAVSVLSTIGTAAASTLGQKEFSGLPILSTYNRVFLRYTNAVTSIIAENIEVLVNSQSPRS